MTWDYLFQPESQILCVEDKQKSLNEWLTSLKLFVISQKQKNLNMAVYSFFQKFCPLIQWYADSYEIVFRISTTSANYLKAFMLDCNNILLKFHPRDQVLYKHYPKIGFSKHKNSYIWVYVYNVFPEPAADSFQKSYALTH